MTRLQGNQPSDRFNFRGLDPKSSTPKQKIGIKKHNILQRLLCSIVGKNITFTVDNKKYNLNKNSAAKFIERNHEAFDEAISELKKDPEFKDLPDDLKKAKYDKICAIFKKYLELEKRKSDSKSASPAVIPDGLPSKHSEKISDSQNNNGDNSTKTTPQYTQLQPVKEGDLIDLEALDQNRDSIDSELLKELVEDLNSKSSKNTCITTKYCMHNSNNESVRTALDYLVTSGAIHSWNTTLYDMDYIVALKQEHIVGISDVVLKQWRTRELIQQYPTAPGQA